MKRLFRIFDLTKNEQRVVLIIMLILITIAFIGYERRTHRRSLQQTSAIQRRASPTPVKSEDDLQRVK
jgi:ABC-type Fe3+ transport system permease subunit